MCVFNQATSSSGFVCLTGAYVGFGSFLAFTVGANLQEMAVSNPGLQKFLYGAIGLPAGLVMVSRSMSVCMPEHLGHMIGGMMGDVQCFQVLWLLLLLNGCVTECQMYAWRRYCS